MSGALGEGNGGSAASHGGKAMPFRHPVVSDEAMPPARGVASQPIETRAGKAEPYRSVRRQSRKGGPTNQPWTVS